MVYILFAIGIMSILLIFPAEIMRAHVSVLTRTKSVRCYSYSGEIHLAPIAAIGPPRDDKDRHRGYDVTRRLCLLA